MRSFLPGHDGGQGWLPYRRWHTFSSAPQIFVADDYFNCFQFVWLNRALLLGSKVAVLALGVLKPLLW